MKEEKPVDFFPSILYLPIVQEMSKYRREYDYEYLYGRKIFIYGT